MASAKWSKLLGFIWKVRDEDLRHHYERHQVGDIILPLVVLRRLDFVLAPTKAKVLEKAASIGGSPDDSVELLSHIADQSFYNTSKFDFTSLVSSDPAYIKENTLDYLAGFSPNVRAIIHWFGFTAQVEHMAEAEILLSVLGKFANPQMDLSPEHLSNMDMGSLYEELLRLTSDLSNKEAGDHFTPREVIELMVHLLISDTPDVHRPGRVFTVYDPTCGTGGMLTEAERHLLELNDRARVHLFGQEIQFKSYAVCTSDMLIKGQDASHIVQGDTLAKDGFPGQRFDYVIANPPYGVDWSSSQKAVKEEHERGDAGRFPAGLPAKTDGQLLFVQHMVAKAKTAEEGGGRVAVVLNGSPLFSGDAGSGESNVRKWLLENDLVEAIIGLPDQLFYNTGIYTYVWILATAKRPERQGLVQLIDSRELYSKMPKSLGDKRNELLVEHVSAIVSMYESFTDGPGSKILETEAFGYTKITVERPLRLRYALDDDARARLASDKAIAKLPDDTRDALLTAAAADGDWSTLDRDEAEKRTTGWAGAVGKIGKPVKDALLASVSIPDPEGDPVLLADGSPKPDIGRRDWEYIPLGADVDVFLATNVTPFAPDAWADRSADRIGYEIPFTRMFYTYVPPRPLDEIDADLKTSQQRILALLAKVTA